MEKIKDAVREVQDMQIQDSDTFQDVMERFYDICRKYGIKESEQEENGLIGCKTTEWTILWTFLEKQVMNYFVFEHVCGCVPEDLRC